MMMILSGAWPQAMAWRGPACGRKASAGASRPAGPGYGLREIQGRESSDLAAEPLVYKTAVIVMYHPQAAIYSPEIAACIVPL